MIFTFCWKKLVTWVWADVLGKIVYRKRLEQLERVLQVTPAYRTVLELGNPRRFFLIRNVKPSLVAREGVALLAKLVKTQIDCAIHGQPGSVAERKDWRS